MNTANLIELARECPDISVTVRLGDLMDAFRTMVSEVREEMEMKTAEDLTDRLVKRDETARILGVDTTTLWRWEKEDYLIPVRVGRSVKYRYSDIARIAGEKGKSIQINR